MCRDWIDAPSFIVLCAGHPSPIALKPTRASLAVLAACHHSPAGTVTPLECAAGKYNEFRGGASRESCLPCSAGKNQPLEGSTACSTCTAGRFQAALGQTGCLDCGAGGYCEDATACGGGFTPCVSARASSLHIASISN